MYANFTERLDFLDGIEHPPSDGVMARYERDDTWGARDTDFFLIAII